MNQLSIKEEFELREKRLKLVYKILYVIAALWAVMFLSIPSMEFNVTYAAIYSCFLSILTIYILKIVQYALQELACMKISQNATNEEKKNAENLFSEIWKTAILVLLIALMLMTITVAIQGSFTVNVMVAVIVLATIYSLVSVFIKRFPESLRKIGVVVDVSLAYAVFSLLCIGVMSL